MNELTAAQRRELRAKAHHLPPVIMIGEAGLTPAVLREIDAALKSRELIKVRVLGADRERRAELDRRICSELAASPVQAIGRMLVLYRPRPEEAGEAKKQRAARPRKPKFRPKRHFQNR